MPAAPKPGASPVLSEPSPRGPGRPSKATVRRAAIVEAYIECIRSFGLAGATVDRVASAMGVSRTLIFHYFGDTQTLVRAVIEHIIANSVRRLSLARSGASQAADEKALLDFAFEGPHFDELQDVAVMAEVTALAGRDPAIAALLAEEWNVWIRAIGQEISACFPQADPAHCEAVGYAIACMGEQHWTLTFLGPGVGRGPAARAAAERLLATLRSPSGEREIAARASATQPPRT